MAPSLTLRSKPAPTWRDGFAFALTDAGGTEVGSMQFAFSPRATNARLPLPGSTDDAGHLALGTERLVLRFEYTRRGFNNDVRYTLEAADGTLVAAADVVFEPGKRRPALRLTQPLQLEVLPSTTFWKKHFPIVNAAGLEVGAIDEPRLFSVLVEYGIQLPMASRQVQAFLLVLTRIARH